MVSTVFSRSYWELLQTLARAVTNSEEDTTAWSTNPGCAIWLGIRARIRIALSDEDWTAKLSPSTREAYRDEWLGVFGLTRIAEPPAAGANKKTASVPTLTRQFSLNPNRPAFPERDLVGPSIVIDKRLRSPRVLRAPVQPQTPSPVDRSSVLTAEFFACQTHDEAYHSVVRELPILADATAWSLRDRKLRDQSPKRAVWNRDGGAEWRKKSQCDIGRGNSGGNRGEGNSGKEKMTKGAEGWTVVKGRKAKGF